jgi:hypothetical protein
MHIGKDGSKSETEALHIPPPGMEASDSDRDKIVIDRTDQGCMTCNRRLMYLGSIITYDPEDSAKMHARIGKANGILHSLNNLWRCKGLSVKMKKQLCIATVMNIELIWGCESHLPYKLWT